MNALEKAERTPAELRAALLKKHDSDDVEAAIEWLSARKLLSEERAVEATVRPRASGKRAEGDLKLRERLERRGAAPEAIEAALADVPSESERMQEALSAKFRPEEGQRAKAGRFLMSRGFEEESVTEALDRFFGDG